MRIDASEQNHIGGVSNLRLLTFSLQTKQQ